MGEKRKGRGEKIKKMTPVVEVKRRKNGRKL